MLCYLFSFYLWSISRPGKNGNPCHDLSEDPEAFVNHGDLTAQQLAHERVITKAFSHYGIPLEITDNIRNTFKSKLWRLGKCLCVAGGKKRSQLLSEWKDSSWEFKVSKSELTNLLDSRKRKLEAQLHEEACKRMKLEDTIQQQRSDQRKLEDDVVALKEANRNYEKVMMRTRRSQSHIKPWEECTRQQQHNRKKVLAHEIEGALQITCKSRGFEAHSVELENINTGSIEILDVSAGAFSDKENLLDNSDSDDKIYSTLYVKDKFSISDQAFHELSLLASDLPKSYQVKKLAQILNSEFEIKPAPNKILGVQQSLRVRLTSCLNRLVEKAAMDGINFPTTIKVKLTGDGTRIARGYSIVNFAFTILEDGRAQSALGNHVIAILKIEENYEKLLAGLQDICEEAKDIEVISIKEKVYTVIWFLGGDWKFLSTVCGLDSANAEHACIWCKCPKDKRFNMTLQWSISDSSEGARTTQEISEKAKLPKKSKLRFNCSETPIFSFIPLQNVIIDHLHLFLRISDVLINLLIRDLQVVDGISKATSTLPNKTKGKYMVIYKDFLNGPCKIKFNWFINKESKKLQYRDLTGPEKIRLFQNIKIPQLFPALNTKNDLQKLWKDFYSLIQQLGKSECDDVDEFEISVKSWVTKFARLYQTKDVTPYMHAFAMHVPQFLRLHGNISSFTQQGLEKLNDITTKFYHRSSNHHDFESLKQVLQKHNRLELLEYKGFHRIKQTQRCSVCRSLGHNKRRCPNVSVENSTTDDQDNVV